MSLKDKNSDQGIQNYIGIKNYVLYQNYFVMTAGGERKYVLVVLDNLEGIVADLDFILDFNFRL